jgi:hypothetical protein
VLENVAGAAVGTLSAADPDSGQTHSFSTADPRFEISGSLLKLKNDQFADLDNGTTIAVEVTSTDSGSPAQTYIATLIINVLENSFAFHNGVKPFDTNADTFISPQDALRIINQLNDPTLLRTGGQLPEARSASADFAFYDTNADGYCTPLDVLGIINFLNDQHGEAEGLPLLVVEPLSNSQNLRGNELSSAPAMQFADEERTPWYQVPHRSIEMPSVISPWPTNAQIESDDFEEILDVLAQEITQRERSPLECDD